MKHAILSPSNTVILAFTGVMIGCGSLIGIHDPGAGEDAGADAGGGDAGILALDAPQGDAVVGVFAGDASSGDDMRDAGVPEGATKEASVDAADASDAHHVDAADAETTDAPNAADAADAAGDGADATDAADAADVADAADAADPDFWAAPTPTMTVYIADATGDGKADLIGVEPNEVVIWPSNGKGFVPESAPWLAQTMAGAYGVFFADMNGDGTADAIVADDVVSVATSTGTGFNPLTAWTSAAFGGDLLTAFSDVNGDGKADGLAIGVQAIWVVLSTGSGFRAGTDWTTADFYGNCGGSEAFADIRGVGYSDAIAMRVADGIGMIPSTGTSFNSAAYALWTAGQPFCGTKGDSFADVNGDGKADAIAVSTAGIQVLLSTGASFQAASSGLYWTTSSFYGAFATFFADVNGDKLADAIAVDNGSVRVRLSNGSAFVSAVP